MHPSVTFQALIRHYLMKSDKFHTLILPLKDKLYRLALSIVKDTTEAEDITQDVLLKLWNKRDEWNEIQNIEAYCFRATKNLAFDRLESLTIRKTDNIDKEKENLFFLDEKTPCHYIEEEEKRTAIYKCIENLSETQQLVFQLREIEEMSYKDISDALDISEDLVKTSLFRARKKLKEWLSDFFYEDQH